MNTVEKYKVGNASLILTPEKIFVKTRLQTLIAVDSNGNSTVRLHRLRRAASKGFIKDMNDIEHYLRNSKGSRLATLKSINPDWYKEYLEC